MGQQTVYNECLKEDCFLCKNIMPEWLDIVRMKRDVIAFQKGELIFKEGDEVEGIYFILEGRVKVDMSWGEKRYIVRLASGGDVLGHRGFGIDNIYPINATALEKTSVCFISTELFKTLLRTNNNLLYKLTFFYADELKQTERRLQNLAHMPVRGRVVESLLMIKDVFGADGEGTLNFSMSRKDIASMSGTTYETVIRTLNELVEGGLISLHQKTIRILDEKKLESCCKDKKRA